jgi:hypothetical protein
MDFSKYHFVYNAAAHFAAMDRYPDGLVAEMGKNGSEGFNALCWALAELSMQGELVRRDMGYDKGETLNDDKLRLHLKLRDIPTARQIITDALIAGVGSSDADSEVDEVMLELQKKTKGK